MKSASETPDPRSVERLAQLVAEELAKAGPAVPLRATLARVRARALAEKLINPEDAVSDGELFAANIETLRGHRAPRRKQ